MEIVITVQNVRTQKISVFECLGGAHMRHLLDVPPGEQRVVHLEAGTPLKISGRRRKEFYQSGLFVVTDSDPPFERG